MPAQNPAPKAKPIPDGFRTVTPHLVCAGAAVKLPVADMFWGDRYGIVVDPFGHEWSIATHIHDLTPDEIAAAAQEAMKAMKGCPDMAKV